MESNKKQLNEIVSNLHWSIGIHFGLEYEVTMTPCTINMLANFNMANSITAVPHPPSIFFHFAHDFCHDEFDRILKHCLEGFDDLYIKYEWDPMDYKGFVITLHTGNVNVTYCREHKSISVEEYEIFCNSLFINFLQYLFNKIPEYYNQVNHISEEEE